MRNTFAPIGRISALAASLMLGACAQMGDMNLGLGGAKEEAVSVNERPASSLEKATEYWAKEAAKNPKDSKAALNYARNLKAQGRKQDALATLQNSYLFGSDNREFLSEYGRLALELDQVGTAAKLLEQADDPAKPDWRVISGRGTAMAKQGDYKGAIVFFERARELAPSQTSLMNNLAMAYTMDGQAEKAEQLLRQAQTAGTEDPRVKQNLALVLGLQGKHQEARAMRGETAGDDAALVAPVAIAADGAQQPVQAKAAVVSAPLPKAAPAVARGPQPKAAQPVAGKSMDPDDVIRAAIEADLRNKKAAAAPSTPVATGAAPKRKATQAGPPVVPTVINAQPATGDAVLRPTSQ